MCGRLTSSTVAPAASSAATASWIRFSTSGSMPATKYSRGRPSRLPLSRDAGLVVARRQRRAARPAPGPARRSSRARRGRRPRGAAPPRRACRGRTGRSGRASWRTRRSRSATPGRTSASSRRCRSARRAGGSSRRCRCPSETGAWYAATATAEPPLDPPGTVSRSHGFDDGPVGAVLVRRAHRELVHVRLAEQDGADVAQPLGDVGVVRRDVALEDPRAGGALAALDRDQVLERDRDAEQRVEGPDRVVALAAGGGQPGVGGVGLGERTLAVDREPRVERPVLALGGVEVGLGQLARRQLALRAGARPSRGRGAGSGPVRRSRRSASSPTRCRGSPARR